MRDTFSTAVEFNQPLDWDTSKVADMKNTFYRLRLQPAARLGHK